METLRLTAPARSIQAYTFIDEFICDLTVGTILALILALNVVMGRLRSVLFFFLGPLAACGAQEASPSQSASITQGTVDNGDPAVVALYFSHSDLYRGDFHCSGTLISPNLVMTAAHCIPAQQQTMHVGFQLHSNDGRADHFVRVVQTLKNERFVQPHVEMGFDIAFVVLEHPVPGVAPEPIRRTPMTNADMQAPVRFVGFGVDERGDADVKRQVSNVVAAVGENTFLGARGADTCSGDSGGPAFMRADGVEVIAGITSFGDESCTGLGTYSRVDVFAADVDRVIAAAEGLTNDGNEATNAASACVSRSTCAPEGADGAFTCACETGPHSGNGCCLPGHCPGGAADPNNCSDLCNECN